MFSVDHECDTSRCCCFEGNVSVSLQNPSCSDTSCQANVNGHLDESSQCRGAPFDQSFNVQFSDIYHASGTLLGVKMDFTRSGRDIHVENTQAS